MLIDKITTGYVVQTFDTETGKYVKQEFFAGDDVNYEEQNGNPADEDFLGRCGFGPCALEPYLPFLMVQPSEMK